MIWQDKTKYFIINDMNNKSEEIPQLIIKLKATLKKIIHLQKTLIFFGMISILLKS